MDTSLGVAFSIMCNAILGGKPHEPLSARSYRSDWWIAPDHRQLHQRPAIAAGHLSEVWRQKKPDGRWTYRRPGQIRRDKSPAPSLGAGLFAFCGPNL